MSVCVSLSFLIWFIANVNAHLNLPNGLQVASSSSGSGSDQFAVYQELGASSQSAAASDSVPHRQAGIAVESVPVSHTNNTSSVEVYAQHIPAKYGPLINEYKSKVRYITVPHYPHCSFLLCGTLHVSKKSCDMVSKIVSHSHPQYVVIELCDARVDGLLDDLEYDITKANVTMRNVFGDFLKEKSIFTLSTGLLTWMQLKAAKMMGNKLGGELVVAAKEAYKQKATVILGDRFYSITIQRCFDALNMFEKIKLAFMMFFEILSMSVLKLKDYIAKTEGDDEFIDKEIRRFEKHLPAFSKVVIHERDEYIAQTLCEVARAGYGSNPDPKVPAEQRCIIAVVGAAHLPGIEKWLRNGGSTQERMQEISKSVKSPQYTWPGRGILHVANLKNLYESPPAPPVIQSSATTATGIHQAQ